ncbi:transcriptional corepressor LEUNIG_HOMOLOG-like isoform X2 [Rutidosis leptorrhynchoides]|uniref:transcriptional corepressor LEUNIG_HOMOLOG-like isoform X2 n=1 Tax=Rutidosis leptorrhynchoides TaxID=125765 RepID=UPI003A998C6A
MAQNWEAEKMLDVYIHDYLLKRKMHESAKAFMTEGKVATDPVAIDAPGGFLLEWWSVFWDIFISRTNEKHSDPAVSYIQTQQMKAKEHQQQMQMQQLHLIQQRNTQLQRKDPSPLGGNMLGVKMEGEPMKNSHSMHHQGLLIPGKSPNVSSTLQQIQGRSQLNTEIKQEVNLGNAPKSLPTDPSSIYGQAILHSKSGLGGTGLNQGVNGLPLKGWPLTGIDNLRPSVGLQVQKPNIQNQNQYYLASQQQQALTHAQAQGNLGSSPNYGLVGLPRGNLSIKDGQTTRNDASIGSPGQMISPKMKMPQMQQSTSQQQDQLQQEINRKRKQHSSSGPANSTGTGNTAGPSPSSPASTHTPGDGINTASSMKHVNSVPNSMMMYGSDGKVGPASSKKQLDDIENVGDVSLDDNVESFLQYEAGDDRELYGTVKQTPTEHKAESSKGFSFAEFGCIRTNKKLLCCHFSSDGKFLASAGHNGKAVLWNMDTLQTESTPEEHQVLITDVRFRPNSTQFGTAAFDKSVRIWDAANPSYSLHAHTAHTSHVMSLDFHPKKTDLFCFCDSNNEIRYWNINPFLCTRVSKGGSTQVRFQPGSGQLLAAASDKAVSIFDVETDRQTHSLQGHMGCLNYLCWDLNGEYLASVSEDCVRVWSVASGDCIHELSSNGNHFYSCVFHPRYPALLVVGGMQSLELWNMAENKSMTVPAHDNIIAAMAQSPVTGMVASASHDSSVKLWK